jgi:hypothetical protein
MVCACTVTSSAVVGSSAISRSGSHSKAMAIMTRWRMPPENSCGYMVMRRAASGMLDGSSVWIASWRALLARQALVQFQHLGHLPLHRQVGVERRHRVLEDHRDAVAADLVQFRAGIGQQVLALEQAWPRRGRCPPAGPSGQHALALAGAALADDAEGLALVQREADAVDGGHLALGHWKRTLEVVHFAAGSRGAGSAFLGVERVAQAVADEVEAVQRDRQQAAGNSSIQGAASITLVPSWISTPQLVIGSWMPRPRKDSTDSVRITPGTVTVV